LFLLTDNSSLTTSALTYLTRIFIFISIFLLVLGCAQRETDIGAGAITGVPSDTFIVVSGTATASASWTPEFTNGYGPSLEVGNALGLFAFFAIRFDPATDLPDSVLVDEMSIRFHRNRVWPDDAAGLQVRVREITESWEEEDLVPGSLPNRESYPILDSILVSATDTFFTFDVPAAVWSKWLAGDTTTYGLLFEPRSSDAFIEFYSSEPLGTDETLYPILQVEGTWWTEDDDGNWTDTTLSVDLTAIDDAYLVIDSTIRPPDRLFVSQGIAGRSALLFPIDTLLVNYTRSVSRAILRVWADTLDPAQITYEGQNILFKNGFLDDTNWVAHSTEPDSFNLGLESSSSGTWDATNTIFSLDVTSMVSNWFSEPTRNGGVQILASNELSFIARQVFYNHLAADSTKHPRLEIWLTESSYSY